MKVRESAGRPRLELSPPVVAMIRCLLLASVTLLSIASLTSCGTVGGLGQDIERLGRKIEYKTDRDGVARGFGEDLQRLGRNMERESDDVYYGESY